MRTLGTLAAGLVLAVGFAQARSMLGAATGPAPVAAKAAPAAPAPGAREAQRDQMRRALEGVLARHPLTGARVGIQVVSLETGEVVYSHDSDELLNPASNVKLVTSATALALLGPEYRFATDFACADGVKAGGQCDTLYIKGRGDPSLYTERIYGIAGELLHRGIRKVGDIVVDDSYFDGEREGPGWEQEHTDKPYMAPAGALSINHNAVAMFITPGETERAKAHVELEPASDYFVVDNKVQTVPKKSRRRLSPASVAAGDHQRLVITGRLPVGREMSVFYKKVDNPPIYAGETFKAILKERGIAVRGKVRCGTLPADAELVFTSYSPALAEIVRELNKVSNNFVAEQLLKTVGAEVKGPPGTWAKGVAAAEEYLADVGIPKGAYVMKNGSGLNDTNRFSTGQLVKILSAVAMKSTFYPEYASSLGIAGRDGTLHSRMAGTVAEGRLRGKTGTLENVTALSGYVKLASNELWAYSILVNDFSTRHGPAVTAVDALATSIAGGGAPEPEVPANNEALAAIAELRARVNTYSNLGKLADKRNLPFLRSALSTEHDPVLRAVVADAIYRSEPESSVQMLLDNVPPTSDAFARLRAVGQELNIATPLVSSLIDVAAEGNADAIDRTLTLAHQAKGDEATSATFADGLQEVGRNAPDELFEALRHCTDEVRDDGLVLLERGISQSDEKGTHPFLERLKAIPAPQGQAPGPAAVMFDRIHKALAEVVKKEPSSAPPAGEVKPVSVPAGEAKGGVPGGG